MRVEIDPAGVAAFEQALPVFGGGAPGFFHNRRPLMGGTADAPLMARARAYLRDVGADSFFDDPGALTAAMHEAGCTRAAWNGGEGPSNEVGSRLASQFGS